MRILQARPASWRFWLTAQPGRAKLQGQRAAYEPGTEAKPRADCELGDLGCAVKRWCKVFDACQNCPLIAFVANIPYLAHRLKSCHGQRYGQGKAQEHQGAGQHRIAQKAWDDAE